LEDPEILPQPEWLEVWVDAPRSSGCYTYRVPAGIQVQAGDIVAVPFGPQLVNGLVLGMQSSPPESLEQARIRPVAEVVAQGMLPPQCWPLLQQVSAYYLTPLTQVLRGILPPGLLSRRQRRFQLIASEIPSSSSLSTSAQEIVQLLQSRGGDLAWLFIKRQLPQAEHGLKELQQQGYIKSYWREQASPQPKRQQVVILRDASGEGLSPQQREVLLQLQRQGGGQRFTDLLHQTGCSRSVIQALARKGRVLIQEQEQMRTLSSPEVLPDQARVLTPEQQEAVEQISACLGQSQTFLLFGVTGSGKTEVYLQTIARVLENGQSALVLVPEIGLTPMLTDRFRARFGNKVLIYHSGLSVGERYDTWRLMLQSVPQVVVGTRSAIFAPLPHLGLIVLDEEHDDSYKQDQPQPCYHARTVARWRSQIHVCPLVLGSATPAVETYALGQRQDLTTLRLPERIGTDPQNLPPSMPPVTLVDLRLELEKGNYSIFSQALQEALDRVLEQHQQAILFVPRRGYSTFVLCRSCGLALSCRDCDVSLTFHQVGQQLKCHYCGYRQPLVQVCPDCGSPYLKQFGSGTQRVVDTLQHHWPEARILRFDSDSTRQKGAHRDLLDQFAAGEADILVGTQMLTKGLDLPGVTLVGVVAADGLLNQSDYRASERSFQLLTQVAGRSGRGQDPGRVIIQTYLPEHPTLKAVQAYDYAGFIDTELQARQEAGYPPYRALILLRLSSQEPEQVRRYCESLETQLQGIPAEILGPCPAQVERVSGWYRWQILLKQRQGEVWDRDKLDEILKQIRPPAGVRCSIDVDPLRIL
jgi:primosomal protein N' (replication factor Y)